MLGDRETTETSVRKVLEKVRDQYVNLFTLTFGMIAIGVLRGKRLYIV